MNRRLIGPTIISLVTCGLLLDHVFFNQSPWSVFNFLSKMLSIFGAIAAPFNPAQYAWFDAFAIPIMVVVLAVLLLTLIIARAKSAMSKVTPNADVSLAWPAPREPTLPAPSEVQVRQPRVPTLPTLPDAPVRSAPAEPSKHRAGGLMAKLTLSFASVGVLFGLSACIAAYSYLFHATEREIKRNAGVMAIHVSEIARRARAPGDLQELRTLVDKYGSTQAVAYVYVEDEEGKIVAHAPLDLPRHLNRDFPKSAERALGGVDVQYRGLAVYEIAKRITEGKESGFVHFGILHAAVKQETRLAIAPIAGSIFVILLAVLGIFVYLTRPVNRALGELVEHAERISKGDFAVSLGLRRSDEVGEIAQSLERMRSSMRAVATRVTEAESTDQSSK